ncbi:MAG: type II toxin-antitoxin system VapC family toxin [Gammaproteobacteria bacterium]
MILPDINLLVYAIDETSGFHEEAKGWWDGALSSSAIVGLCYPTILGFIRLVSSRQIFIAPLSVTEATDYIASWLAQPNTTIVVPTPRHWPLLKTLLHTTGIGANLTTDAHIAALAIEHGFTVFSNDTDFARFDNLRWENPLVRAR